MDIGQTVTDLLDTYNPDRSNPILNLLEAIANPDREYRPESIIGDYLEPVGDSGTFVTPNTPADPQDCDRYPESPWCGGAGVNIGDLLQLIPASVDFWGRSSGCETCLEIQPTLFWISLPLYEACYRLKLQGCRPPEEQQPTPPEPPNPQDDFGPWDWDPYDDPDRFPGDGCGMTVQWQVFYTGPNGTVISDEPVQLGSRVDFTLNGPPIGVWTSSAKYRRNSQGEIGVSGPFWAVVLASLDLQGRLIMTDPVITNSNPNLVPAPKIWRVTPSPNSTCIPRKILPPPPPPPPPRCCPMSCCCKSNQNNDEIEALLRLIARRLGTDDYPVKVPQTLLSDRGSASVNLESLTQFQAWFVRQMDALIGEFPVKVEIADEDPTASGNQAKTVNLPNLAESIAEIYGLTAKTAIDSDVHTSFLIRLATEAMAIKTATLITQDYASANASFLGYKGNQVKRNVRFAFNPNQPSSLSGILTEAGSEYVGWQNQDRESAFDYFQKLMFAAGIIKSVFFRKRNDVERMLGELKEFFDQSDEGNWDEFVRQMNDPNSDFNRESTVKPEIDKLGER